MRSNRVRERWDADCEFGYRVDRVVEEALVSSEERRWVNIEEIV